MQLISSAQNFDENHTGSWLEFSGTASIHNDWSIPIAGILKHDNLFEAYDFSFIRTGVSYRLSQGMTCTGGIAFLNANSYSETQDISVTSQFWVYEQFTFKSKFRQYTFSNRWRLENRWVKAEGNTKFNNRIRYRLQGVRNLYGNTYIKVSNEVFINLKGELFNQNRFYIGIGQSLSPSVKVAIGYLKNHFSTSHYNAISMAISFNLDLTSPEVTQIDD